MLDVLLLSAILFASITLARRSGKPILLKTARLVFVLIFVLLALNLLLVAVRNPPLAPYVRPLINSPSLIFKWRGMASIYLWVATIGLLIGWLSITVMIHSLIYRREKLIKAAVSIVLIISPFAFITFAQATIQWIRFRSGKHFVEASATPLLQQGRPSKRIVWVIFDEFDFRLAFVERPASLELPEFDRLRKESIVATNSYPPGGDTELSLPALFVGRLISRINRTAPNELELTFGDENQSDSWSTLPSVFSRARAMGLNSGLAGWYHPYCRILGTSLTKCSWETATLLLLPNSEIPDVISRRTSISLAESMRRVAKSVLLPETRRVLFPREQDEYRRYYVEELNSIHRQALSMAVDPTLNLVLIHYPIPHPPGIYDRHAKEFSFDSTAAYLDNLALADRVLGQLRQRMMETGIWETTTVLVSSDHRLRADRAWRNHPFWKPSFTKEDPLVINSKADERVPFILKLTGETQGMNYEPEFNTVLSHDLVLALLSGDLSKKEEVAAWLDSHRSLGESPYKESR